MFFDRFINVLFWGACILLIFITVLITGDVVMRYFLNRPIIGAGEISENCLLFITFLGTAWVLKKEKHISIDFISSLLKPRARMIINSIVSLLCAAVCLIIAFYGAKVAIQEIMNNERFSTLLGPPSGPIHSIIPIGSFLLFIQFLRNAVIHLMDRNRSVEKRNMN